MRFARALSLCVSILVPWTVQAELSVNHLTGFGVGGGTSLCGAVAGLSANLVGCFDAGDATSYNGTSQTWTDKSGTQDFWRGADGTSSTDDPTFNGSAGGLSALEYFSNDAGDFFRAKAQPTWANNLHKDNAAFTVVAFVYPVASTASRTLFATVDGNSASDTGAYALFTTGTGSNDLEFWVFNGSGSIAFDGTNLITTLGLTEGAWNMVALSVNEAGGAVSFAYVNGAQVGASFDAAYTSPSASAASFTVQFMRFPDAGGAGGANGDRLAAQAVFSTALTTAQLDSIWAAMRGRFGL